MPRRLSFPGLTSLEQPVFYVALALIGGMLCGSCWSFSVKAWLIAAVVLWPAVTTFQFARWRGRKAEILLLAGYFALGGAIWAIDQSSVGEERVRRLFERGELRNDEPIEIVGTLSAAPELAPDRIYLSIDVSRASTLGRDHRAGGAVQIVVPFNDHPARVEYDELALAYGTRLRLLGHLSHERNYRNPGAPDFDELLGYRGFDASGWVKSPLLIERLGEGRRNFLLARLYRLRAKAIAVTLRSLTQPASGILVAALFGNRYFLSRETAESFRAGGTFHLLVISGLHVAMIALVVLWVARRLSPVRTIQYLLVLLLMWSYALMVGGQPAITRSVVMLTIVLGGQIIFRVAAGANTLAASAIALLVWQPRDLFNPGFQLSFLTVAVIVLLTGPIYLRLKEIGEWTPSASTPYPPRAPAAAKWCAEVLWWNETRFREEMKESRIRYRLGKAGLSIQLNRLRFQKALAWMATTILATTGVQIGLLPLMISQFHRVSLISPLTNVIEGALVFVLMLAGAGYLVVHSVIGGIVLNLAPVVNWLGSLTVRASDPMLKWRKASLRVPDPGDCTAPLYTIYFIAILALVVTISRWNPLRKGDQSRDRQRRSAGRILVAVSTLTIVVLGWFLIAHPVSHRYDRGRLSITFLDVGQGDAMLISFPGGSSMMLDSGGRPTFNHPGEPDEGDDGFVEDRLGIAEAAVMPYLWHRGINRLDWIVASHGDADHVEAFVEIARSFEIGSALRPAVSQPVSASDLFDQAVRLSGSPLRLVSRGEVIEIEGSRVECLSPFSGESEKPISDNDQSLVLKLTLGERSFLLTGDIERKAEDRLVTSATDLAADVLKVAHHGSRTSSTAQFLGRVKPKHAVISAANPSPFGHPHAEVIERLRETGARIWRTGDCGAITISTDGRDLRIETFVECQPDQTRR